MVLLSCAQTTDAERYTAALSALSAEPCTHIDDRTLQAECLSAVSDGLLQQGRADEAGAACAAAGEGRWRDECFFRLADEAGMVGEEARAMCPRAGRFADQCINHAAARDVEQTLLRQPRYGREKQTMNQMVGILAPYVGRQAALSMARSITVSWLARRDDAPFSARTCGTLPAAFCLHVYAQRARSGADSSAPQPWQSRCSEPLSPAVAAEAGLPPYEAEMQAVVSAAWTMLCSPAP